MEKLTTDEHTENMDTDSREQVSENKDSVENGNKEPENIRNRKQAIISVSDETHPSESDSGVQVDEEKPGKLISETGKKLSNPDTIIEEGSIQDSHSVHSKPKPRKVSVEPGYHPEMEKHTGPPIWQGLRRASPEVGHHMETERQYHPGYGISRKISNDSVFLHPYHRPERKKSSIQDAFYLPPPSHSRISVVSVMTTGSSHSDRTFEDPTEVLPDADFYRDYTSVLPTYDYRQRPTLEQLRDGKRVSVF